MLTWKKLKPTFGWGKTERKKYSNLPAVALGHWEIFKINVLACAKEAVCNLGTMQTRWKKSYLHTEMSKSCVCDSSKGGGGGRFFFFFFCIKKKCKNKLCPQTADWRLWWVCDLIWSLLSSIYLWKGQNISLPLPFLWTCNLITWPLQTSHTLSLKQSPGSMS